MLHFSYVADRKALRPGFPIPNHLWSLNAYMDNGINQMSPMGYQIDSSRVIVEWQEVIFFSVVRKKSIRREK